MILPVMNFATVRSRTGAERLGFLTAAGTCAHFALKASDTSWAVLGPTEGDIVSYMQSLKRINIRVPQTPKIGNSKSQALIWNMFHCLFKISHLESGYTMYHNYKSTSLHLLAVCKFQSSL